RQVVRKARSEGLAATAHAVRGRLAEDLPLGYSAAGQVVEVGSAVSGLRAGQGRAVTKCLTWQRVLPRRSSVNVLGQRLLAGPSPVAVGGWPTSFTPLDAIAPQRWPTLAQLASGRITLLNVIRDLDGPAGWQHADAPLLWWYHLHYWDWAWV